MTTLPPADAIDAPAWSIRAERPIDLDRIHDLHRAAFPGPAEAELVDTIRTGAHFVPELSLVAVTDDGSVLGHVLVSHVDLQPDAAEVARLPVLALAPIAVLPPHQGRGIGSALMREVIDRADRREEPLTVVLGSPPFYARFGFVPALPLGIIGPYDAVGDAFQVRPRPGTEVTAGRIIYPPAFGGV